MKALRKMFAAALVSFTLASCTSREAWLAEYLSQSVFELTHDDKFACSTFYVGDNMFVTAGHCITTEKMRVVVRGKVYEPIVTAHLNSTDDWAVMTVLPRVTNVAPLNMYCDPYIYVGKRVAYFGYPHPLRKDFSVGIVSSLSAPRVDAVLGTDYLVNIIAGGGASGSPLTDMRGNVIGIVVEEFLSTRRTAFRLGIQEMDPVCRYINGI